ncbi:phosphatase PAP2 family protein [Cupriavidus necator]|nr:phosphatase PAP2 family protein [Cupriavidus necator]
MALAALVAGCAAGGTNLSAVPELRPGVAAGYLAADARPDSLKLLPGPPAQGSPALALDEDAARQAGTLRGSARWQLATEDAVLTFPRAAGAFSCALGVPVSEKDTPYLNILLRRSLADAGLSTYGVKDRYKRTRPFVANKTPMCTPAEAAKLEKDGSYPSGHSAIGWAWALILAEVEPERANDILARGRAFGQSRVVCNVHWQSDVNEGRMMAAATVARLHADPTFRADLDKARREVAAARASGARPSRDCQAESAALAP